MTGIESALIENAGGNFYLLLLGILVLFILTISGLLVRCFIDTIPKQLQSIADQQKEDRMLMIEQNKEDRRLMSEQIRDLIITIKDSTKTTNEFLVNHNEQAKQILNVVCEMKGKIGT